MNTQMPQMTRSLQLALRELLSNALHPDTFAVTTKRPKASFLNQCVVVFQPHESNDEIPPAKMLVAASSSAPIFAFVDRTANTTVAAEQLLAATYSFGSKSTYAPDVVFVHEAVEKPFKEQLVGLARGLIAHENKNGSVSNSNVFVGTKPSVRRKDTEREHVLFASKEGSIVEAIDT